MAVVNAGTRRVASVLGGGLLAAGLLGGCASQIAALAPVGGDNVTAVRNAAIDVVTGSQMLVKDAPRCSEVAQRYACVGTTTDGLPILVDAPVDGTRLTVTVGTKVLYAGKVRDVLDAVARGEPIPPGDGGAAGGAG